MLDGYWDQMYIRYDDIIVILKCMEMIDRDEYWEMTFAVRDFIHDRVEVI